LQRQRQVKKAKVYKYTRFEVPSCKYACIFLVYKSQIPELYSDSSMSMQQGYETGVVIKLAEKVPIKRPDLTWQGDEWMQQANSCTKECLSP